MILPATSVMMPRPSCAGLPVMDRSVATVTVVDVGVVSASVMVTMALAWPLPRESFPLALITAFLADSSVST